MSYSFDPLRAAIDTLFRKCYENDLNINDLRDENEELKATVNESKSRIYDIEEKFVIIDAKIGPIDPSYYQFWNIYAELHSFSQKLKDIEKQINNFKEQDEETIEYVKHQLRGRVNDLYNKIGEIEKNIKAYISLVEFREMSIDVPSKYTRSESLKRMNNSKLMTIDPLIEKVPESFEEEKECLKIKLKDLKSRIYTIESSVREEAKVEDKIDYNKRIDELFDLIKRQKKTFDEFDEKMKSQLLEAKTLLLKNTKEEIDKLRDSIFKKLKDLPKNESTGAPDESSLKAMKDNISMLLEKNKENNERFAKIEHELKAAVEDLERLMRTLESKSNKTDFSKVEKDLNKLEEKFIMLCDQVNNIKIPEASNNQDDSKKYMELERTLVALSEKLDRTNDALNQRMNDINKFMDMIKEDVDKTLEEYDKQILKVINKTNICEFRIETLEKQLKDMPAPINRGLTSTFSDFDGKEVAKALKELEAKFKTIKEGINKF